MAEKKKLSLEEAMSRLETVVSELENEKLPLEKSLKLYEEGVKLASICAGELEAAKNRIKILQQGENGKPEVVEVPEGTFSDNE